MKGNKLRQNLHLRLLERDYPRVWEHYDMFIGSKGDDDLDVWPDWCLCPMAAAAAIVSSGGEMRREVVQDVARVAALAAWRMTKTVYRFDPAFYIQLIETKINKVPVEMLYRLPQWCVYVETPWIEIPGMQLAGFYAHLEHDVKTFRTELRLLLDVEGDRSGLIGVPLHLTADTIGGMFEAMCEEATRQSGYNFRRFGVSIETVVSGLQPIISLILYLCSDEPDYGDSQAPRNPRPKKTKGGVRIIPAASPTVREVGVRFGEALRKAYNGKQMPRLGQSERRSPSTHVRDAHWHTFWTGPRDGEKKARVKWLPPILVNPDGGELPIAIRNVKE